MDDLIEALQDAWEELSDGAVFPLSDLPFGSGSGSGSGGFGGFGGFGGLGDCSDPSALLPALPPGLQKVLQLKYELCVSGLGEYLPGPVKAFLKFVLGDAPPPNMCLGPHPPGDIMPPWSPFDLELE